VVQGAEKNPTDRTGEVMEATTGFEPVNDGFAIRCLTTWPRRRGADCRPTAEKVKGQTNRARDQSQFDDDFFAP
jgi:hypothetical protein